MVMNADKAMILAALGGLGGGAGLAALGNMGVPEIPSTTHNTGFPLHPELGGTPRAKPETKKAPEKKEKAESKDDDDKEKEAAIVDAISGPAGYYSPAILAALAGLGGGYVGTDYLTSELRRRDIDKLLAERENEFNQLLLQEQADALKFAEDRSSDALDRALEKLADFHMVKAAEGGLLKMLLGRFDDFIKRTAAGRVDADDVKDFVRRAEQAQGTQFSDKEFAKRMAKETNRRAQPHVEDITKDLMAGGAGAGLIGGGIAGYKAHSEADPNRAAMSAVEDSLAKRLRGDEGGPGAPMPVHLTPDSIVASALGSGPAALTDASSGRDLLGNL